MGRESALQLWRVVQDKPLCRIMYIQPRGFGQSIGTHAVLFSLLLLYYYYEFKSSFVSFFFLLRTADVRSAFGALF